MLLMRLLLLLLLVTGGFAGDVGVVDVAELKEDYDVAAFCDPM